MGIVHTTSSLPLRFSPVVTKLSTRKILYERSVYSRILIVIFMCQFCSHVRLYTPCIALFHATFHSRLDHSLSASWTVLFPLLYRIRLIRIEQDTIFDVSVKPIALVSRATLNGSKTENQGEQDRAQAFLFKCRCKYATM